MSESVMFLDFLIIAVLLCFRYAGSLITYGTLHRTGISRRICDCRLEAVENTASASAAVERRLNARQLNERIIQDLSEKFISDRMIENLRNVLKLHSAQFTQVNAVTLLHRCCKRRIDARRIVDEEILLRLLCRGVGGSMDNIGIGNMLYSLQYLSDNDPFAMRIITTAIDQLRGSEVSLNAQSIANALYGMKSFEWTTTESMRLLEIFLQTVEFNYPSHFAPSESKGRRSVSSNVAFTAQGFSNCLLGVQNLPEASKQQRQLFRFLAGSVPNLATPLDPFSLSNAILALRSSTSDNLEARNLLRTLVEAALKSDMQALSNLDGRSMSMMLWGIQGMSSEDSEVIQLLELLNTKLVTVQEHDASKNTISYPPQLYFQSTEEVSLLLSGMRGLSSDHPTVRTFIRHITHLCKQNIRANGKNNMFLKPQLRQWQTQKMSEKFLASAYFGCQRFDDRHIEVRSLLQELNAALASSFNRRHWCLRSVATALYGLQNMSTSMELYRTVQELSRLIDPNDLSGQKDAQLRRRVDALTDIEASHSLSASIGIAFQGLKSLSTEHSEVTQIFFRLSQIVTENADKISLNHTAMALHTLQMHDGRLSVIRKAVTAFTLVLRYHLQSYKQHEQIVRSTHADGRNNSSFLLQEHTLSESNVVMMMQGIAEMSADNSAVRNFIGAFAHLLYVQHDRVQLSPRVLSLCLRCLKNMGSRKVQVPLTSDDAIHHYLDKLCMTWTSQSETRETETSGTWKIHDDDNITELKEEEREGSHYEQFTEHSNDLEYADSYFDDTNHSLEPDRRSNDNKSFCGNNTEGSEGSTTSVYSTESRKYVLSREIHKLLIALLVQLKARGDSRLNSGEICSALYGLQGFSAEHRVVRGLLRELADDLMWQTKQHDDTMSRIHSGLAIKKTSDVGDGSGKNMLTAQHIGNALYGFQNMSSETQEVRYLLRGLARAIDRSPSTKLSTQAMSNALYGLQKMSNHGYYEIHLLLQAFARKMPPAEVHDEVKESPLSGQQIAMALWGFRKMVLRTPRDHYDIANDTAYGEEVTDGDQRHYEDEYQTNSDVDEGNVPPNKFVGFVPPSGKKEPPAQHHRPISRQDRVLLSILQILSELIRESPAEMTGQQLANAFFGLQGLSLHYTEVRAVMAALAHKLILSRKPFTGLDFGMTLYAMRNMDSSVAEARVVLGTLLHRMRSSSATSLQLQELSMSVMGILQTTDWLRDDFLRVLMSRTVSTVALDEEGTELAGNE